MNVPNNIDINNISTHIADKRRQVTDAQLELRLLEEERVRMVNRMCLDPIHYYIDGAMAWLTMRNDDKVDKRKKCDEIKMHISAPCYDMFDKLISIIENATTELKDM